VKPGYGRSVQAAALAPMDRQGQGIGSRLEDGVADLRSSDCQAVIVLGHPDFYPRFGFSAALAAKLAAPLCAFFTRTRRQCCGS
jgi:putative acetyltransferase